MNPCTNCNGTGRFTLDAQRSEICRHCFGKGATDAADLFGRAATVPDAMGKLVAESLAAELVPKLLALLTPEQYGRLTEALTEAFAKRIAEVTKEQIQAHIDAAVQAAAEAACKSYEGKIHDLVWERMPDAIDRVLKTPTNRFNDTSINPLAPLLREFQQRIEAAMRKLP